MKLLPGLITIAVASLGVCALGCSSNDANQRLNDLTGGTGSAGTFGVAGTGSAGSGSAGTGSIGTAGTGVAGTGVVSAGSGGSAAGSGDVAGTGVAGDGVAAGSGGESGAAGTGAAGASGTGAAGTGATANMPPCKKKASQVVIIGDSYINWGTHTFPQDLATAAGETWRMYAVGGYSMGSGGIGLIPPELDQAIAADKDIIAVVMDGGGNDILIPAATWAGGGDCKNNAMSPTVKVCQDIVTTAFDAAKKLMQHAADSGIKDVVYFFYPHVPEGTLIGGAHPNAILEYALPMARDLCVGAEAQTQGKLRCHFLDLSPIFQGHTDWFAAGDIHENSTGSAAMAKAVVQLMKDNCVAQPASAGCCAP